MGEARAALSRGVGLVAPLREVELFDVDPNPLDELIGSDPVDDAMVEAESDHHHRPNRYGVFDDDGFLGN